MRRNILGGVFDQDLNDFKELRAERNSSTINTANSSLLSSSRSSGLPRENVMAGWDPTWVTLQAASPFNFVNTSGYVSLLGKAERLGLRLNSFR